MTVCRPQTGKLEQVTPGYEELAKAVTDRIAVLPGIGLTEEAEADAEAAATEALTESISPEPVRGKVRRAVAALTYFLTPIALDRP